MVKQMPIIFDEVDRPEFCLPKIPCYISDLAIQWGTVLTDPSPIEALQYLTTTQGLAVSDWAAYFPSPS